MTEHYHLDTLALHAGHDVDTDTGSRAWIGHIISGLLLLGLLGYISRDRLQRWRLKVRRRVG